MKQLSKQYDAGLHEDAIYLKWEESGVLAADNASRKEPYVISMPPPNATGELHIGHALFLTIQDVLIRTARMQGREVLWLPGTDHAAIATESVVIRKLQAEGIADPRRELGRDELVRRIAKYVERSRGTIRGQIRKMGASCDWSRERYTLEPALSRVVTLVFKQMYEDGLIYRRHRIVNWDPALQTTVSDDEVQYIEEKVPFYTLQYGPFQIGTARPETKFGDKYVVMHPDDARYKKYKHGDTFIAEWINGPVKATVIKDDVVDPEFGTGVMTITPWHDPIDFSLAERHGLDQEQIIDFDGTLLPIAGEFAGQPVAAARPNIVEKLGQKGLLVDVDEAYAHRLAVNSRGKGVIEPQIKLQWFVDVNKQAVVWKGQRLSLKEIMQEVIRSGDIRILPPRFEKTYFNWIDNLRDWCISRQIWWGHRIPVWYRGDDIRVGEEPGGSGWQQDTDTLDTWFSSALWTWSTLIDPAQTEDKKRSLQEMLAGSSDFQKFHPTTVMETGHDIIFFWVARMILITTYITGGIPFKDVFLHGLITTPHGKKMSKSDPDSMVDPLRTIADYGADATRFGLMYQMTYGSQTIKFDEEAVKSARNFANKIWNLARFIKSLPQREEVTAADRWIEERLGQTVRETTELISQYRVGEASRGLYNFVWNDFADWYVEIVKIKGSVETARRVFVDILKLLHPYLPYLTETLWQEFEQAGMLISAAWPAPRGKARSAGRPDQGATTAAAEVARLQDIVTTVRSARSLFGIKPATEVIVAVADAPLPEAVARLCRARLRRAPSAGMKTIPLAGGGSIAIGAPELTNEAVLQARKKLTAEMKKLNRFVENLTTALGAMRHQAPPHVVAGKEAQLADAQEKLQHLQQSLKLL
jgi:valyl-tRNA synthetase